MTDMTNNLRERCRKFLDKIKMDAMLRQGNAVDDLWAFVESEKGRASHESLEDTRPLILYFGNEKDREEFLTLVREAMPNLTARNI